MSTSNAQSEIEIERRPAPTRTDRSTSNPLTEDDESGEVERLRACVSALERQIAVSQKQLTDAGIEIQVVATGDELELAEGKGETAIPLGGGKDEGEGDNGVMADYFATSTRKILMGRLPWLFVLLLIQSSAAAIMATFEQLLDKELVIALFVPMIVGSGGNAGNQPGVAVTRALGAGEISPQSLRRLITREAGLGFITACILGSVAFFRVLVEYPGDVKAAVAISLSLFVMVFLSIILGVVFSIGIDKIGVDPANGAAPMLTTITDLIGITILCGFSEMIFEEV